MPNGLSDGALIIDTGLNNSGFFRDAKQFKQAVESLKSSVNRVGQQIGKSGGAYGKALQEQTRQAKALNKEIETTRAKYTAVVREMNEVQKTGGSKSRYNELSEEAKSLSARLSQLRAARETLGGVEQGFENVAASAGNAGQTIAKMAGNGALSFLKRMAAGAKNAAIQLAKLAGRAIQSGLKKIGQLAGGAAKKLFGLGRGAKSSGQGFQFSLKNMLKYGLGIRSLFVLFNRLRSAIKEGFDTLANYDPRVKAALASLKGALSGLKGSLAGAFAPILTAAAPALTTLINLLTQAVNAVGMFMAAITGQGYYMAAKGISAVGGAASSASGSVKDLKRQLAGFDELNILSANSGGGSGGGAGSSAGYSYEQMPIAGAIADFAAQMKALVSAEDWDGLGHLLADKVNGVFDRARQLISWDNLGDRITKVVGGITGTINGFVDGIEWKNIGATFAEGLNTLIYTVDAFVSGINWAKIGKSLTKGLNAWIARVDWEKLGGTIKRRINGVLDALLAAVKEFDWGEAGTAFVKTVQGLYSPITFVKLAALLGNGINGAVKTLTTIVEGFDWGQAGADFAAAVNRLMKATDWMKLGALLGAGIQSTIDWLKGVVSNFKWGDAGTAFANFINGLADKIDPIALGQLIEKAIKEALDFAIGWFKTVRWREIGRKIRETIEAIDWPSVADKIYECLKEALSGLYEFFAGLIGEALTKAWENVKELPVVKQLLTLENWIKGLFGDEEKNPTPDPVLNKRIQQNKSGGIQSAATMLRWMNAAGLGSMTASGQNAEVASKVGQIAEAVKKFAAMDYGAAEEQLANAPKSVISELLGLFVQGAYGEESGAMAYAKAYAENTKALNANTKAEVKQTKAIAPSKPKPVDIFKSVKIDADTEWDTSGWKQAFEGVNPAVTASVNFLPQGAGGTGFLNKPLEFLKKVFSPGTDTTARVGLVRQGFTTVAGWIGGFMGGAVDKAIGVVRNGWNLISNWINGNYMGGAVNAAIGVVRSGWTLLSNWAERYSGGDAEEGVSIFQAGWRWLSSWAEGYSGGDAEVGVSLYRSGWSSPANWVKSFGDTLSMRVSLTVDKISKASRAIAQALGLASGGIVTAGGRALRFAAGGMLSGSGRASWWHSATKYASGTSRAHGTMFVAGEAGPEIVGHVNGRTEILNKSQLAQTMQAAVQSGMVAALHGITFTMPAMATGGIMPYEVSAQIARSAADIQGTLNANNEDLIQTIISVAGQLAAALNRLNTAQPVGASGLTAQQVIDEINRRTLMYGASPLRGV